MTAPIILALDTSTPRASVAAVAGDRLVAATESGNQQHAEDIIGLIDEVLTAGGIGLADLAGVAVGAGPGSFTGLRIGMATAKGLCFAAGKPLWAVSSLAALALEASAAPEAAGALLVPILDARRKEVFVGFYAATDAGVRSIAAEAVLAPAAVGLAIARCAGQFAGSPLLFGDGALLYRDHLESVGTFRESPARPAAEHVARLAAGAVPDALATVAPVYIRKSEAEIRYPDGNPGGSFKPLKPK
jgi:tRNA threonylcarbamoyladenosine biosynthesis protein TsaB